MVHVEHGFFFGRREVDIANDVSFVGYGLADYVNVPAIIGAAVSSGKATLHELDTIYSLEDVYDMLEIATIDAHNRRIMIERANKED